MIFYVIKGTDKADGSEVARLKRVRRAAVRDWLKFLSDHHFFYKHGIRNRDVAPGTPGEWLVPPFEFPADRANDTGGCVDWGTLDSLPEDGVPEGLDVRDIAGDETIDDDAGVVADGSDDDGSDDELDGRRLDMDSDSESGSDATSDNGPSHLSINSLLLGTWLRDGGGVLATEARRKVKLEDVDLEAALNAMHGTAHTTPRATSITLRRLAERLIALDCLNDQAADEALVIDMLHSEFKTTVEGLGISFDDSGVASNFQNHARGSPAEEAEDALDAVLGKGTSKEPFEAPPRNTIPLSEYKARGYMTLAFPTLFPFGTGHYEEHRAVALSYTQWAQHLEKYHDGRFARHPRWPYFALNTRERAVANDKAQTFLNTSKNNTTLGDLRKLSHSGKNEVFSRVSKFASSLRNTPAFFVERRKELQHMCEQLGDPHVFATNSFADTYCPYLARFIISWAQLDKAGDWNEHGPFADGLNDKERHSRRRRLLVENPHLAATFPHLKTKLYIEHVCHGILGADAWWVRYEWQSRGSTHAHYFLWFRDTPQLGFLDEWVDDAISSHLLGDDRTLAKCELDAVIEELRERAEHAARGSNPCQCADPAKCTCDDRARRVAAYWDLRAHSCSDGWNEVERCPDIAAGAKHPASQHVDELCWQSDASGSHGYFEMPPGSGVSSICEVHRTRRTPPHPRIWWTTRLTVETA